MPWTEITPGEYRREGSRYASDMTAVIASIQTLYSWLRYLFADGGYAGRRDSAVPPS